MHKYGSLLLTLAMGFAPIAIAQNFGTATSPVPDPAAAQNSRVLTQQGRALDENAVAKPGNGPSGDAARARIEVRNGNDATRKAEAKGPRPDSTSAPSDQARVARNPTVVQGLKVSRERSPGTTPPDGSGPTAGTPGSAVRETALRGPDTVARDSNAVTTKTNKPFAVGETAPDVDVSKPKTGPLGSW
jgi:hypothetical protein